MGETSRSRHGHGRSEVLQRTVVVAAFRRERRRLAVGLRKLRARKEWSQEEASERLGIHPVQLARMEAGTANVTLAVLVAAALAYGVEVRDLFPARTRRIRLGVAGRR